MKWGANVVFQVGSNMAVLLSLKKIYKGYFESFGV